MYTEDYFFHDCEGFKQFHCSKGRILSPRLKKMLQLAEIQDGMRILDIGCGRGELSLHGAAKGATTVGCDLSMEACRIASDAKNAWAAKDRMVRRNAIFCRCTCTKLPFRGQSFDLILLSDIMEHLHSRDAAALLLQAYLLLKPSGSVVLHTSPNRYFIRYGLLLYSLIGALYGRSIGLNPKAKLPPGCQYPFHVNEQSMGSIRRMGKRAGFTRMRLFLAKNPQYIYYLLKDDIFVRRIRAVQRLLPIRHLFCSDIYGILTRT